ncbi:MAG: homocysteine S-methyltransferase family protein [Spirochaetes bacterium]|nr:homocysteine S-methyltransferase family protein [Spirochaetota bacterium]
MPSMQIMGRPWHRGEVLLADGAWGTEFHRRGLMQGNPSDEWNLSHPDMVRDVTREYLEAGSTVILTNTFGASRIRLEQHGLGDRVRDITLAGARIAREVVGDRAVVAGDIGPSGRLLALGETTAEELYAAFAEQAGALADGGVDWIVVESMSDAGEMAAAVRAAYTITGLPVVASMTYNRTARGFRTMMGDTVEQCVARAEEEGAAIVGANCGSGIEDYVPLAPVLRQLTERPVWIKANAGVPHLEAGQVVFPLGPAEYASFVPALVAAGVDVIGGCCGTGPDTIREVGRVIAGMRGTWG